MRGSGFITLAPAISLIAHNLPTHSSNVKMEFLGMVFWHRKTCVVNRCLFGIAPHHLLIFHGRGSYTGTHLIQRVRSQMTFKAWRELPMARIHSSGLSGALHFQTLQKPHPCLEKKFFFPSLADVILLLWRGSECHMTLLEKSPLTYFCRANSPLHSLFFY